MPATKNQDLRLDVLDQLLGARKWSIEELLERINQAIADEPVNKRTLFRDIKYLAETKAAPIHRPSKGDNLYYYTEKFSLKNIPIDDDDIASLKNAIQILKEVDNFSLGQELDYVIRKLENRINVEGAIEPVLVQFEKHTSSRGSEHIGELLEVIRSKNTIRLSYQPYTAPMPTERMVHPYLLKEFRNRWFLIGREENATRLTNYALDRIKGIRPSSESYIENNLFNPTQYFEHLIGVSIPENGRPESIEIKVHKHATPYVVSKPIHANQRIVKKFKDGSIVVELHLVVNFELKSVLLSYGDGIEVKEPKSLRKMLKNEIAKMKQLY